MIIERLKLIQGQRTNKDFSAQLGLHEISWIRIKNRRVPVSDKLLVRVLRAFPEMKTIVDLYIMTESIESMGNLSSYHQKAQDGKSGGFKVFWSGIVSRAKKIWHNSREP